MMYNKKANNLSMDCKDELPKNPHSINDLLVDIFIVTVASSEYIYVKNSRELTW